MGAGVSKNAPFDVQNEENKSSEKQSFTGRLRSKILRSPSSTAAENMTRTQIIEERFSSAQMSDIQPFPGLDTPNITGVEEERKLGRGVIPPALSFTNPPDEYSLPILSSGDPRSPAPNSQGPRTPITNIPQNMKSSDNQPNSLVQERMKEAAAVAIKKTAVATPTAAAD